MIELIKKWYPEDDPITEEQGRMLIDVLGDDLTEEAFEGFLVVCSRFVTDFGDHRTSELFHLFRTHKPEGRRALLRSLEHLSRWVGGMDGYLRNYPVTIQPPLPAFPQLKIVGIETLEPYLYRTMDSNSVDRLTGELVRERIKNTGKLPAAEMKDEPVLRAKPFYHWCSFETLDTPDQTRDFLQILPEWNSDCRLRAKIRTSKITDQAFVAYNGDRNDKLKFIGYFHEPHAYDHPPLAGGGTQVSLSGSPPVEALEEWNETFNSWSLIWKPT